MPKLIKNSKLSNKQLRKIVEYFALELTAVQTAKQLNINRHTVDRIYLITREKIAHCQEVSQPIFHGEIEPGKSYPLGKKKYERGQSAKDNLPVFGILEQNGKIYTQIIPDLSRQTLVKIIRTRAMPKPVIFTDRWRSYDGLILDGYKLYRITPKDESAKAGKNQINDIESFCSYAKSKLAKHYGIPAKRFYLHLKEIEFRFNHRNYHNLANLIENILIKY